MNTLELCKKFAQLEGITLTHPQSSNKVWLDVTDVMAIKVYNPITNLALNCAARDKYEVSVTYADGDFGWVVIDIDDGVFDVNFSSKEDIPRAVIKCILKSKGVMS